jgi:methylenetetrahydrofolate reductase (NADPH)
MRLRDIYTQGTSFSIEFFPPKTPKGDADLFQEIDNLKALGPAFCSVTYGAGGSTREKTVDLVTRIRRSVGLEVMCHVTVVDQPKEMVRGVLEKLKTNEIHNIIALAGDPPQGLSEWRPHPEGFHYAVELVREAVSHNGWFSIAVAGFPEVHPRAVSRESDLQYLKAKVEAGADAIITQLFFDNDDYYRFVNDLRTLGVTVPIIPGILPIQSAAQTRRFTTICGSRIPARLETMLQKVENDDEAAVQLGIDYATEQCAGLLRFGAPGIHFYSLNKSRSLKGIFQNLSLKSYRVET